MRSARRLGSIGTALALATVVLTAQPALAGCQIEVTYKNEFQEDIQTNPIHSKVKIQGGVYKKLGTRNKYITIPAYGQKTRNYTLDFGCNHDRRYKFHMVWAGIPYYKFKPSENGWTRKTELTVKFNFPFP
jgi:hypothetical protein